MSLDLSDGSIKDALFKVPLFRLDFFHTFFLFFLFFFFFIFYLFSSKTMASISDGWCWALCQKQTRFRWEAKEKKEKKKKGKKCSFCKRTSLFLVLFQNVAVCLWSGVFVCKLHLLFGFCKTCLVFAKPQSFFFFFFFLFLQEHQKFPRWRKLAKEWTRWRTNWETEAFAGPICAGTATLCPSSCTFRGPEKESLDREKPSLCPIHSRFCQTKEEKEKKFSI